MIKIIILRNRNEKSLFLIGIILVQVCSNCFAGGEAMPLDAKKAARLFIVATMRIKDNRAKKGVFEKLKQATSLKNMNEALGLAGGVATVVGTTALAAKRVRSYFFTKKKDEVKHLISQQEQDFHVARKTLIDSLNKNADGEIGASGLPKGCDQAVRALVVLPGGQEELEKIKDIFQKYFGLRAENQG
jgi:methylmalonyl-CoA mutase cobalamin-binding subunit